MNFFLRLLLISGLVGEGTACGVEISVHTDEVINRHPVHPFGINLNYLRDVDALWPEETRTIEAALRDMKVRWLRYPGGEKSDHVRFASPPYTAAGPIVYDNYAKQKKNDLLDFDEYIALCRRLDAEPWVVVPYDTAARTKKTGDFAEHAAGWVHYANRIKGYEVRFWEIGNENWHTKSENPNPRRSRDIRAIAQAMKKVDPAIRIAASGVDPAITGDLIDVISLSGYVGTWEKSNWKETFDALQDDALLSPSWKKSRSLVAKSGRDMPLAVVEWSFKYDKGRNDLISALGALDVAGWQYTHGKRMVNHMYWTTRYMDLEEAGSVFCTLDIRNELTATGRAAWVIGNYFTCEALACHSSEPLKVHAYAFLDRELKAVNILVINRAETEQPVAVELRGVGQSSRSVMLFSGAGPLDEQPIWQSAGDRLKMLPAYSAAIVQAVVDMNE